MDALSSLSLDTEPSGALLWGPTDDTIDGSSDEDDDLDAVAFEYVIEDRYEPMNLSETSNDGDNPTGPRR